MTRTQSLEALIAAIVDGDDAEVSSLLRMIASKARDNGTIWPSHDAAKAFHGSLDAAKALHEAVLHESVVKQELWSKRYGGTVELSQRGHVVSQGSNVDDNPARSWLLAILRALLAQEASA